MARWPLNLFRARQDPDTTKAATPAPAATFTTDQVVSLLQQVSVNGQVTGVINPLPRTDPQVAFGPGVPLIPAPLDPVRPDTGRPEPRLTEYPVSSNLPGINDRLVPWKVLRDAAAVGGLARRCIEIRKAEVATLNWTIGIAEGAAEKAQTDNPGMSRSDIEAELGKRLGPDIARCTTFWEEPNRREGETFGDWIGKLLEEHLVLDALAIYPRLTYGGDLYSLEILDGTTIKVLRDNTGGRPQPPSPAYQQILWGFPRGEFLADTDDQGNIVNGYRSDRLIYKRRNVRTHTQYGYSAVEQALEDIDVWLRRRKWIRDEYTEGTVPTAFLRNDATSGWNPQQIREYERDLNDMMAGQTAERHRIRLLPPGFTPEFPSEFAEKYRPEYDLYLIKQIASHFDVTIAELGFTEPGGLGSTGWHEGQADVQQRKATLPTVRWLQQLITSISRTHLGMPAELEFRFLGLEDEDEAAADQVALQRIQWARMTINEDRDRLGLPRYPFPEADMPMMMTTRGVVFLDGASKTATPGVLVAPPSSTASGQPKAAESQDDSGGPDEGDTPEGDDTAEAVKAELAAYHRWARKNPHPKRPFAFTLATKADAPDLNDQHVIFAGQDGEPAPKDEPVAWPAWDRDQTTATQHTVQITATLAAAVDTDQLAERWTAQTATGSQDTSDDWYTTLAVAFLAAQGITLTAALAAAVTALWTEGWAIGAATAQALLDGHGRPRYGWRPGDSEAARRTLTTALADALQAYLDGNLPGAVQALADRRLRAIAQVLAHAAATGMDRHQLAQALRDALADDAWARMTALTELTRASAEAARTTYQAAGLTRWQWTAEPDACPTCLANAAAGPRTIGEPWPDGATAPPAHPHCRCAPLPA